MRAAVTASSRETRVVCESGLPNFHDWCDTWLTLHKTAKTYVFQVVVEPDEDVWAAHCPALLRQGASTWGHTRQEALSNIAQVVKMVVESLLDHGDPVPEESTEAEEVPAEPQVVVAV